MPFPLAAWEVVGVAFLIGLGGWALYVLYLHPDWQKQRRVIEACEAAFAEGDYTLVRLRVQPGDPSLTDLLLQALGRPERHFTYSIRAEEDPELSGVSREEARLVRRYLHRDSRELPPYYGRKVLREGAEEDPFQRRNAVRAGAPRG